ncbi:MAG: hypothetical protein J6V15_05555, partial [Clostridia bacterium]|nr:hypothetical protein [Clostridia bacterium]
MPVIPATGHDWDSESCKNCNRPVPVYTKVTNQAQFDALADDTMYILVAEYNGKHYAMDFSEVYSYMTDSDGDGFYDVHNVDDDSDGIPDYLEFDEGGGGEWGDEPNGVYDYLEWDMDNDGDVDDYDLHEFHLMVCEQHLTDMLYDNGSIKATEITINPDGTISHAEAAKTAEFEMVDVYLAEEYNPEWHSYWENGEMPYHTECVKQFVIPNYFLTAPGMRPIERMYLQRIYDFGDSSHWGVLFYDSRDEYFSYVDGDMDEKVDADEDGKPDPLPFPDVSKEGSVAVFDTFDDIGWILYNEGQKAQLRLRDYNGKIGFVTGHDYELDWEWVDDDTHEDGGYYNTNDTQVCVYLYASAPYTSHTCQWSDWTPDDTTDTHSRFCTVDGCTNRESRSHNWDAGTETQAPTCTEPGTTTYTCPTCRATKTSPIPALDHDWDEWTYDSVDSHIRACKRTGCTAEEFGGHEWGNWVSVDENTHKMTCSVCSGTQSDKHGWDNGVVTKVPTEWETGIKTYTCLNCGHTKTETVDMLDHECVWTDWYPDGEQNHKRDCMDDNCDKFETLPHSWDEGEVTKQPSCSEKGEMTYTCQTCMYTRTEDIPTLDHEFGDWTPNTDDKTHSRSCACGESETEEHNFDNGEVTQSPTHEAKGEIKYTCADCGYSYLDELPEIAEHQWDEWIVNKVDEANTHIRYCFCGESETAPHAFDNGAVTVNPTHTSKGEMTYTCSDCGYSYTEEIEETPEHSWTDWSPNSDGTHSRACRCNANETASCAWDE